jgi:5-methylcytosine-specific restriction endonuclease McrA
MSRIRPKKTHLRLDSESYKQLCRGVLQRDGWRCQLCGGMANLQIHHKEFRSHCGDDSEPNMVTVCAECHSALHRRRKQAFPQSVWL